MEQKAEHDPPVRIDVNTGPSVVLKDMKIGQIGYVALGAVHVVVTNSRPYLFGLCGPKTTRTYAEVRGDQYVYRKSQVATDVLIIRVDGGVILAMNPAQASVLKMTDTQFPPLHDPIRVISIDEIG